METASITTTQQNTKEALSTIFHCQILMTEKGELIMPEMTPKKTPEQQIEELKTSIGALAEMLSMFYLTLIGKGIDEDAAITLTSNFLQWMSLSIFKKGDME